MALDPVPWAVGNGAHNSVEGARRSLYDSTGGARGVTNPTDMEVTALPVPGDAVRVHTGSCKSPNDYLPSGGAQSYSGHEQSSTDVPVTTTGSAGTRINFLLWRVDDPQYAGQAPEDVVNGPYNRYVWVGSNPYTSPPPYPHVPLVRLDQPANTSTITGDMLTDIREVANPRRDFEIYARPRLSADNGAQAVLDARHAGGGEYFPGGVGIPNQWSFDMPTWPTRMVIDARWLGVQYQAGRNVYGNFWIEFGNEYRDQGWSNNRHFEFATEIFAFNGVQGTDGQRDNWLVMDTVPVPAKLRGKRVTFVFKASLSADSDFGVSMNHLGGLGMRVDYAQQAESFDQL